MSSDEVKRRFEVLARQVFVRFKALEMEQEREKEPVGAGR